MHIDDLDGRIETRKYWSDLSEIVSYIRLLCAGVIPLILNAIGLALSSILGFKPFRVYDLSNSTTLAAMPSGFLALVPLMCGLLFETLVPTALQLTF